MSLFLSSTHLSKIFLANVEYSQDESRIIAYFRGPEITRKQMSQTVFKLSDGKIWKVDSKWWEILTLSMREEFTFTTIELIKKKRNQMVPNLPILIDLIGHGVGGANQNYLMVVYTFGSPRVGDSQFGRTVNEAFSVIRITNSNDFAPHYPKISTTGERYLHAGQEYWLPAQDCNCPIDKYIMYECPGFFPQDENRYGENLVGMRIKT
ncbi:hypothetical protein G9A89_001501 [Geosiphon pyriformis]|nr:hypothetical protein G9A89_001501 [Geosiphon pyriformis]